MVNGALSACRDMKNPLTFTRHVAVAGSLALAIATGCTLLPSPPSVSPSTGASLYERLGGMPAISAMVDDAVANIAADRRINARFTGTKQNDLSRSLVDLVCERTGGPCIYRGRNMASAHDGMLIRDDEFDALVEDMMKSLEKFKVPVRERDEVARIVEQMRNAIVGH